MLNDSTDKDAKHLIKRKQLCVEIGNQRVLLVTIVTVLLAFVEPEIPAAKKTATTSHRYLVGILVLGLMTVAAGVAAYVVYR